MYHILNYMIVKMESPENANSDTNRYANGTPKTSKRLYWPKFQDSTPKMCGFPERQEEFGWDDSPEPLKLDPKLISGHSKKRLESLESPVSSHSKRPPKKPSRKRSPSTDQDLAVIQELSRRIRAERAAADTTSSSSRLAQSVLNVEPQTSSAESRVQSAVDTEVTSKGTAEKEGTFDSVIESFFTAGDDDEWLSQVDVTSEPKPTPNKPKFVKSLSANQLESPKRGGGFQRSQSFQANLGVKSSVPPAVETKPRNFAAKAPSSTCTASSQKENESSTTGPQPLKKQKSFHVDSQAQNGSQTQTQTQYSLADIEKKRLEAKYRREFREIERKKLEAQKRLNERRARAAAAAAAATTQQRKQ